MIVGFSDHGLGAGSVRRAFKYLLAKRVSKNVLDYLLGEKNPAGVLRKPAPVILRGDPKLVERLINNSPHRWKYTSGVLSFQEGEMITPEMECRIMNEFETLCFAGLSAERYAIVFIRHSHLNRLEIHFLAARQELVTGKSLNIAPPGRASRRMFDLWRSKINAEYGLADPDDPARWKVASLPDHITQLKNRPGQTRKGFREETRECITRFLEAKAREGLVHSRTDVVRVLEQAGFTLPRQGKDSLTVQHPVSGERVRLRGAWFMEPLLQKTIQSVRPANQPNPELAARFARQLAPLREARARYHLARYGQTLLTRDIFYDGTRIPPARCAQAIGSTIPVSRSGVGRHAPGLDRATRELERAAQRLERAHRAFARDFEAAVSRAKNRRQVKTVLRDFRRAFNRDFAEEELERELER